MDAEIAAEFVELRSAAETLGAEFQEVAIAALRTNHAARTPGGLDNLSVDTGIAQVICAGEAGDACADDEDWNVSGHED